MFFEDVVDVQASWREHRSLCDLNCSAGPLESERKTRSPGEVFSPLWKGQEQRP